MRDFLFLIIFRLVKHILLFMLTLLSFSAICQPNYVIDTIILPGHYIQKVSASRSSDVWIIEDTNSRNVFRIDKYFSIYNHSLAFQTATNSHFTTILNNDTNNTLVGTANDFVYHWSNNSISKISNSNGLTDSTINAIVGWPKTIYQNFSSDVKISANTMKEFSTNDYVNFTPSNMGVPEYKTLEREKVLNFCCPGSPVNYELVKWRANSEDRVTYNDWSTGVGFGVSQNWHNINTATVFYRSSNLMVPNIMVGTDNGFYIQYGNYSYSNLYGEKVTKIIKCHWDSRYALVGSNTGLYSNTGLWLANFDIPSSSITLPAFPGYNFKVNDIDISPNGCVYLATDTGLIKLKDINCSNYKTNFNVTDSVLMLNQGCEINFNSFCSSCEKSWKWSFGDGTNSSTSNPSHIYSQSGPYTIKLISGNGTCNDTVTKNISLLICCDSSNYNFVNLGPDSSICNSTILNAGVFTNSNYLWSTGASTQTINVNTSGNYWVKLKNQNGCPSYDTIHISVNQLPSVNFSGLSNNYCSNASTINLIGTPAGGVFFGNGISGNSFSPSIAGVGTHTVTYSYTDGNGCSNTKVRTVTVNANPSVSFSGLASDYCLNSAPVTLTGSPLGGTYSGNGILGNVFNPANASVGIDSVMYTYTDGNGCGNTNMQQVIINSLPPVSFTGLSYNYCVTESPANIAGTPSGGIFSGSGIVGNSFNPSTANIGSNTVTYNYTDTIGCSNAAFQTTDVAQIPMASVSGDSTICSGETDTIVASGVGSFLWSTGDTSAIITPSPTSTTTYSVTASNFCGNSVDSIVINVNPLPVTTISTDTTILLGNSASLNVAGGTTYLWTPALGLSCTDCPNPVASPQSTTIYSIIISGVSGCSVIKKITIIVSDDFEIFVPDVFSPNGDGQNDVLYIRGTGIKELNFVVYDRLGEKIFESNAIAKGWDGTYKGIYLNNAVFVYYLSATMNNDKKIITKGDVTLIR